MSNEEFFLQLAKKGYFKFTAMDKEQSSNGVKTYSFNFHGLDPLGKECIASTNKIRFNQIGGFIDLQEIEV